MSDNIIMMLLGVIILWVYCVNRSFYWIKYLLVFECFVMLRILMCFKMFIIIRKMEELYVIKFLLKESVKLEIIINCKNYVCVFIFVIFLILSVICYSGNYVLIL